MRHSQKWTVHDGGGGGVATEFSTASSGQFMIGVMVVVVGGRWRWGGGG